MYAFHLKSLLNLILSTWIFKTWSFLKSETAYLEWWKFAIWLVMRKLYYRDLLKYTSHWDIKGKVSYKAPIFLSFFIDASLTCSTMYLDFFNNNLSTFLSKSQKTRKPEGKALKDVYIDILSFRKLIFHIVFHGPTGQKGLFNADTIELLGQQPPSPHLAKGLSNI